MGVLGSPLRLFCTMYRVVDVLWGHRSSRCKFSSPAGEFHSAPSSLLTAVFRHTYTLCPAEPRSRRFAKGTL